MWCCQLCGWCLCPWLRRWAPQWSESWCLNRCGVLCLATMGRSQMCQWGISPWWNDVVCFRFHGENDMPVYVFWGILFSDTSIMVMGCYESTWSEDPQIVVNSYQFHITNHPTPCDWDLFWSIFTWFSDDFRSQIIPEWSQNQNPRCHVAHR